MAFVAFPLDNTDYTASAMGAYLGTRTRGVFSADGNLAVTANGNMTVTVGAGLAWLLAADYWGLAVCADGDTVLIIPAASGTLSRIDAVCLRLDKTANAAELVVKQGAAASSPVLPAIVRNDNYDEIYLAAVSVPAGAVSITAADITDLRLDEDVCGLMRDGVTGIPTAQLQEQAEALMEQLRSDIDAASSGVGISVYTHSKSGTVHALTGSGPNGRVLMTADVAEGDTVTVNGTVVPAYVGADGFADALAGQALDGRWLTFVFDGTQVNFKGGGGAVTVEGLAAESVLSGCTVTVKQGAKVVQSVTGSAPVSTIAAVGGYAGSGYATQDGNAEIPAFVVTVAGTYQVITAAGGYDGGSAVITLSKNGTNLGSKTQGNGYGRHTWTVACAAGDTLTISYTKDTYAAIKPILTVLIRTE